MSPRPGSRRRVFGAVDLGASGGRVMAGEVDGPRTTLHAVHRFANGVVRRDGHLRWDLTRLLAEVETGLAALAEQFPQVESVGVDTWGVDYGLLDADGRLLAEPVAYRDDRTAAAIPRVDALVPRAEQYRVNGLQHLPFTTVYQLDAERRGALWDRAAAVVLLPDLIAHHLTGVLRTESTNASTTGLLDATSGRWAGGLITRLNLDPARLPPLEEAGAVRGELRPGIVARTGLAPGTVVTTVGSHDTASAVVAVPAPRGDGAYVSSGTWSLVGVESDTPNLTETSRAANFTNERGVDGRIRYLRNVGGLWLLQECLRDWSSEGDVGRPGELFEQAALLPGGGPTVDVDDPGFLAPDDMPARIGRAVEAAGGPAPRTPVETVRCVLDSLADGYARTVAQAADLSGQPVRTVHVVGGGSRNRLLCDLTAARTGRPVVAGPVEATALGNVLVQARALGAAPASLEEIRADLAATQPLRHHLP